MVLPVVGGLGVGQPAEAPVEEEVGSTLSFPELDLLPPDTGAPGPQGLGSE